MPAQCTMCDVPSAPTVQGPLNVSLSRAKAPGMSPSCGADRHPNLCRNGPCTLRRQLQDATDSLVTLMYNNVNYLTKKANFKQVNPSIPITQEIPDAEDPATFEGEICVNQPVTRRMCLIDFVALLFRLIRFCAQPANGASWKTC